MKNKRVGDLKCTDIDCSGCPLRVISCVSAPNRTLYEMLDLTEADTDLEIYEILKKRLDREVE